MKIFHQYTIKIGRIKREVIKKRIHGEIGMLSKEVI